MNSKRVLTLGVVASLLTVGLAGGSAGAYESGASGVLFRPAGDFDGDGRTDLVSLSRTTSAAGVGPVGSSSGSLVVGMRGFDGGVLWRTTLDHPASDLTPVAHHDGRGGVLVVGGDSIRGPGAFGTDFALTSGQRELRTTMLGPDGLIVWDRVFDSGEHVRAFPVGDADRSVQVYRSHAAVVGTLSAVGDSTTDVVVTVTDRLETPGQIDSTTRVLVLDGATGDTAAETVLELTDARPAALPVGDLNGDGSDDIVIASPGRGSDAGVRALSGADLAELWQQPSDAVPAHWYSIAAGDLDADGVDDLLFGGYDTAVITTIGGVGPLQSFVAFSGATGAPLLQLEAHSVFPLGSVDAQPGVDLGLQTVLGGGSSVVVRYEGVNAFGGGIYSDEYDAERGTASVRLLPHVGDVDGDGINDAAHGVEPDRDVIISGRTGQVLRTGPVATPIGPLTAGGRAKQVRVNGAGTGAGTVTLSLIDGLTGAAEWTSPALSGGSSALTRTADVDGDGVLDLAVDFANGNPRSGVVLDGRTGALRWQTPNVTD